MIYEQKATDQNIIQSIVEDKIGRTSVVADFLQILDKVDGDTTISINGAWGSGKTFFIKQVIKILEAKRATDNTEYDELNKIIQRNQYLKVVDLEHTYLPIYYDAWLYDDHGDPLLSLLFMIVKEYSIDLDEPKKKTIKEKLATIVSGLNISVGLNNGVNASIQLPNFAEMFKKGSFFEEITTVEDSKEALKEIFELLLVEQAERLIIFIDELDRCNPTYAINVLERVKHFLDDDRLIFVYSINKDQLVHTICRHYGQGMNGTIYLNKFFDYNLTLPSVSFETYAGAFFERDYYSSIIQELSEYYNFSMREINRLLSMTIPLKGKVVKITQRLHMILYCVFFPLKMILQIRDVSKYHQFITGKSSDLLLELFGEVESFRYIITNLLGNEEKEIVTDRMIKVYLKVYGNKKFDNDFVEDINVYKVRAFFKDCDMPSI